MSSGIPRNGFWQNSIGFFPRILSPFSKEFCIILAEFRIIPVEFCSVITTEFHWNSVSVEFCITEFCVPLNSVVQNSFEMMEFYSKEFCQNLTEKNSDIIIYFIYTADNNNSIFHEIPSEFS